MTPVSTTHAAKPAAAASKSASAPMKTLKDLLVEQLNELYASEAHSEAVLARLASATESTTLSEAIRTHIEETRQHLSRLDRVFGEMGLKPVGAKSPGSKQGKAETEKAETHGSKGLLEDCASIAGRTRIEAHVRDAAIIAALQRVEHDEIAGYGCARTWATLLGFTTSASELLKTLTEERRFDESLTRIAETLNKSALEPVAPAR